ncbi:MAG: hypothetical protein PVI28_06775, partial [Gammaproteobacteria bacterium]
ADSLWANPLARHLTTVLVVKLLLLALLWWLFFRPPEAGVSPLMDVHTHIAGPRAGTASTLTD